MEPVTREGEGAQSGSGGKLLMARIARGLVYFVYGLAMVAVVILAIAFFLKLFAANPEAPFAEWIYRATDRIMQPFRGLFPSVEGEQGSVLDVSLLFAMLMYGLLAVAVHALVEWLNRKVALMRQPSIPIGYGRHEPGAASSSGSSPPGAYPTRT